MKTCAGQQNKSCKNKTRLTSQQAKPYAGQTTAGLQGRSTAAADAVRAACIVRVLGQAPDQPVSLNFPGGRYLIGLQLIIP
ncbi:MAG: hypothetical protein ACOX6W_05435 [Lentisphaeria bacterium]